MLDRPLAAGADTDPSDRRTVADRLAACRQAFLAQPQSLRLGSLQIVDLSRLRQRLGNRWPDLRCRVAEMIDATLARNLGPDDLSLAAGEDFRYVLRIGAERRKLERQGELLAADVTGRLCGTIHGGAAIRVSTMAFDLDPGLDGVTSMAGLGARIAAFSPAPDRCHDAGTLVERLQPRFRPVLHLRKRLVSAYQLTITGAPPSCDGTTQEDLDGWSLRQAAEHLPTARGARAPGLVVNVSYATLASMRWREPFMRQCRRLPRQSAGRLIFEVLDLPLGLPQARVRELMAYLRPFCLAIVARLPTPGADLAQLTTCGIGGLSVSAESLPADEHTIAGALATLAGGTRAIGLRSCLVEANSAKTCRAALAAGIDHVCGDQLMPSLPQPGRALLVARGGADALRWRT